MDYFSRHAPKSVVWFGIPFTISLLIAWLERVVISKDQLLYLSSETAWLFQFTGIYRAYRDTSNYQVLYLWLLGLGWPVMFVLSAFLMSFLPFRPAARDPRYSRTQVILSLLFLIFICVVFVFAFEGWSTRYTHRYFYLDGGLLDVLSKSFWFGGFTTGLVGLFLQFDISNSVFTGKPINQIYATASTTALDASSPRPKWYLVPLLLLLYRGANSTLFITALGAACWAGFMIFFNVQFVAAITCKYIELTCNWYDAKAFHDITPVSALGLFFTIPLFVGQPAILVGGYLFWKPVAAKNKILTKLGVDRNEIERWGGRYYSWDSLFSKLSGLYFFIGVLVLIGLIGFSVKTLTSL